SPPVEKQPHLTRPGQDMSNPHVSVLAFLRSSAVLGKYRLTPWNEITKSQSERDKVDPPQQFPRGPAQIFLGLNCPAAVHGLAASCIHAGRSACSVAPSAVRGPSAASSCSMARARSPRPERTSPTSRPSRSTG